MRAMPQAPRAEVSERLARLQSVTDSALTMLDVDDLLEELLVRVCDVLDADTAAVLLLEPGSGDLVATAAIGIEEEVHQAVHIPLGSGFAGRVAATRGPIRLNQVDATTVANPILWEKGIRVMLGVPLLGRRDLVLGVLHVGRLDDRPFTDDEVELLRVVADRVAAGDAVPPAGGRAGRRRPARAQPAARRAPRSPRARGCGALRGRRRAAGRG